MGNKLIVGVNDLKSVNPELAAEWNYEKNGKLLPENISANSHKKVWWIGKCGHEWESDVYHRNKGHGCLYCSGQKVLKGFNDLMTKRPDLISEWHPTKNGNLKPTDVTPKSGKKVWWIGKCGHEWESDVYHRNKGHGCPFCSGQKVLQGFNDLQTINPELASEWNYEKNGNLTPSDITSNSSKKFFWKGKCGHEWEARVNHRNNGIGCPYCAGQQSIVGINDVQTINPELASEWHPTKNGNLRPTDVMPNSGKKIWWLGKCGHEWKAAIYSRNVGRGCVYCSGQKLLKGFNDLMTKQPDLALEWNYKRNGDLKPDMIMTGSDKKVWWICNKGHEWEAFIYSRNHGYGCPVCNESHLEKYTREVLQKYHYSFKEQVTFNGLKGVNGKNLSYDFGVYENGELDFLIECQGGQHYEPVEYFGGMEKYKIQLEHDRLKRDFCQGNHILLIEIPYTYSDEEIEVIFSR